MESLALAKREKLLTLFVVFAFDGLDLNFHGPILNNATIKFNP